MAGDVVLRQQLGQRVGGFVFAHHRQQRGLPAQRSNITRHIGCAARAVFGFLNFGNGHGGFGRDARHVAKPVLVQHHIACHQYFGSLKTG